MVNVFTCGVFDMFHYGHLNVIKQSSKLGDKLIVGVLYDDEVRKRKREPVISESQRLDIVYNIKGVNEVHLCCNSYEIIPTLDIDIFVVGGDQYHGMNKKAIKYCQSHGIKVVRLQVTSGISTSDIIKNIKVNY